MKHETLLRKVICFLWVHHRIASSNQLKLRTMWKNLSHVHPSGLMSIPNPLPAFLAVCSLSLSAVKKLAPPSKGLLPGFTPPHVQRCVQTLNSSNLQAVFLPHLPLRMSVSLPTHLGQSAVQRTCFLTLRTFHVDEVLLSGRNRSSQPAGSFIAGGLWGSQQQCLTWSGL